MNMFELFITNFINSPKKPRLIPRLRPAFCYLQESLGMRLVVTTQVIFSDLLKALTFLGAVWLTVSPEPICPQLL